ncbi:DSPc-domain-containing protein [Cylindrobasidium torrendii FP15055 ss-10]|uniref:protein-tyrosine-phosphatase n=1 Tax=Cylindrobasidium torrendii FP15055 ss-10 TaxID=1314674 RepID=A0A0D7BEW0_9AGAR|nr:DSPc-domain-containing protein [Cylindrobasidium torrendii FP15055 ss-10]
MAPPPQDGSPPAQLVHPPYLFLGDKTAASADFLTAHGIKHVVSVGIECDAERIAGVDYHHVPLSQKEPEIGPAVAVANELIRAAITAGEPILVHCRHGQSRSVTIVTAFLMQEYNMTLKGALGQIVRARNYASPNSNFTGQLQALDVSLHGTCSLVCTRLPSDIQERLAMLAG